MRTKLPILMVAVMITLVGWVGYVACDPSSDDTFDRQRCLVACRYRFGGTGAAIVTPFDSSRAYNQCIEECEKKAWKEFDSRLRESPR